MKTLLASALTALSLNSIALAGNFFGAAPFNNEGYWPGYLNGKYMGVVTGDNISGVLGFAIVDGAPPFRINDQQSSAGGAVQSAALVNQTITPDVLQNYFTIFVEGRTYFGQTTAGIDLDSSTVAGALQGTAPAGLPDITVAAAAAGNATVDALSVLNRGLSGGFTANINSKKATFTFSGTGELSTPANNQTITLTAVPTVADNLVDPLVPANTITNEVISGRIVTETTPFNLSGIRTSFNANNPAALQDAQDSQGGGGN
jgi:hypothetical protein